ncbi:chemotaxis protein CheB [Mariniphaga sediminis]|uniref:protein-glutamate methylesterase n=1 Tax=Mariniphaga sediminis TaxID=1628158 RepID=A0A399D5I0_9BACT|nr:chemotaxis protein CheB [Mariniphaga sediminis]RIH66683.1 chemotaxis protein CheB [Mariniphaga sediminis]
MIKAVAIGTSYGGMEAIRTLLSKLPDSFHLPVIIVLHIGNNNITSFLTQLNKKTYFTVKEAEDKETIREKTVYFAPPNYHLQVEDDYSFSLSTDKKINYSRPSIDVLFETSAWTFKERLVGILLTGSNYDGARGLLTIKKYGGKTIVENPETAFAQSMPSAATELFEPDYVLDLENIADKLLELSNES